MGKLPTGVGALAARSAVLGARLNVRINAAGLKDKAKAAELVGEADQIATRAVAMEQEVLKIVEEKIG
jgi:glutamate formiminotransferase/formiminotetrahydrofolate cyclodeaminase